MEITAESLEQKLRDDLQASHVEIIDETSAGCGLKFSTVIVSEKFEGKPLLQRHRLVNACLAEELKTIHAFSMKTLTPADWTKRQQQSSSWCHVIMQLMVSCDPIVDNIMWLQDYNRHVTWQLVISYDLIHVVDGQCHVTAQLFYCHVNIVDYHVLIWFFLVNLFYCQTLDRISLRVGSGWGWWCDAGKGGELHKTATPCTLL